MKRKIYVLVLLAAAAVLVLPAVGQAFVAGDSRAASSVMLNAVQVNLPGGQFRFRYRYRVAEGRSRRSVRRSKARKVQRARTSKRKIHRRSRANDD